MIKILYCDDVGAQRRGFEMRVARELEREFDASCETAGSYLGFREKLESGETYDVVVTDMNFEKAEGGGPRDGLEILRDAKLAWSDCEVLLLTAFLDDIGSEDLRALFLELKLQPDHVLSKVDSDDPWRDLLDILRVVGRLVGQKQELEFYRNRAAARSAEEVCLVDPSALEETVRQHSHHGMIGRSFGMVKVFQEVARFAPYDKNVLISGETGSGKGMVARAVHRSSRRAERPFSEHNSSTIHENIAEGELFGFAPDSGVSNAPPEGRKGVLVATDSGSLFLDEIGDMPLSIQAKMLKVIDQADGTFFPVGAEMPIRVDLRFIAATHKNLEEEVLRGNFRQDFLFRIRGVEIHVPPLRERKEDIPLLVADRILRFCTEYDRVPPNVSRDGMRVLTEYSWPGNIRQLQNVVDGALMALQGDVGEVPPGAILALLHSAPQVTPEEPVAAAAVEVPRTPADEARTVFDEIMQAKRSSTLSQLKRQHGEPIAAEVMRLTLLHFGRYPTDEQAKRLFGGMTANAWRQFAFSHGITLRKIYQESQES